MLSGTINFSSAIARENSRFSGRNWVLDRIGEWVGHNDGQSRFYLLTGQPGSGKTAISARLAAISGGIAAPIDGPPGLTQGFLSAVHFCNSREVLWNSPMAFSQSIASQLAHRYAEYEAGLQNLCSRNVSISIEQQNIGGSAIGIGSLEIGLGERSPQETFLQLCRDPLEKLAVSRPDEQILILIDAIDESLVSPDGVTIAELIAQIEQLPTNVRFIITSREKLEIESMFGGADLNLSSSEHGRDNSSDLEGYVNAEIASIPQLRQITLEQRRELWEQGNFLYAYFALRFFQRTGFTVPGNLPDGLPQLMTQWLTRLLTLTGRDWADDYAPILGTLLVARESLDETRIAAFTQQNATRLLGNLADLRELFDIRDGKYSLYHDSLREFLAAHSFPAKQSNLLNRFRLAEFEQHERVAGAYGRQARSWAAIDLDDYGLKHLATHLAHLAGEPRYEDALYAFISRNLLLQKRARNKSDASFAEDVFVASEVASGWQKPNFEEWIRCSVIRACLQTPISRLPSAALGALALSGHAELASSLASLRTEPYDSIFIAEAALGRSDRKAAIEAILGIQDDLENSAKTEVQRHVLDILWASGDADGCQQLVRRILTVQRTMGAIHADVFEEMARFCTEVGDTSEIEAALRSIRADPMFSAGPSDFMGFMASKIEALLYIRLAEAWLSAGQRQKALDAADEAIRRQNRRIIEGDVRVPLIIFLQRVGEDERPQKLAAPLQREDRLALRRRRALAFGDLAEVFAQARAGDDEELLELAVKHAIERNLLELAVDETAKWEKSVPRDRALRHIAENAAGSARWTDLADALNGMVGLLPPEEMWHMIAECLGNADLENFRTAAGILDDCAPTLEHGSAELQATVAFGYARHGMNVEALARVNTLIEDARETAGKSQAVEAISAIAACLNEQHPDKAAAIASEVAGGIASAYFEKSEIVTDQADEILSSMHERASQRAASRKEMEEYVATHGLGKVGEKLDEMHRLLAGVDGVYESDAEDELGEDALDEAEEQKDNNEAKPMPSDIGLLLTRANDLNKLQLLDQFGARTVSVIGARAVLDAAFSTSLQLMVPQTLLKIAEVLAADGAKAVALEFIAGHLERTVKFAGNDSFFVVLDEYISLLNRVGQVSVLWRIYEALMEFGMVA